MDNTCNTEASKDPGIFKPRYTEQDYEGHRAHSVYVGVHIPSGGRRHSHSRKSRTHISDHDKLSDLRPMTPPAQRVQFIIGEEIDDNTHESHPLFSEMEELVKEGDEIEWKETARWVKFEEDVEEGGDRWSKPHVATLSLHSLFELRSLLTNGTVMLDMQATNLEEIADIICDNMVNSKTLSLEAKDKVREALLLKHRHQHERKDNMSRLPIIRNLTDIGRNHSSTRSDDMVTSPSNQSMQRHHSATELQLGVASNGASAVAADQHKVNTHFMKKIPPGAEASNILVGEVEFLDKTLSAFVRLNEAAIMGDLTEVPVPTRFLFILLGPPDSHTSFHEIGRAMATLLSDEIFHVVAYRARKRDHLLAGLDEFLDALTVLPPGEWDPNIRIEPPAAIPSQDLRKRPPENQKRKEKCDDDDEDEKLRQECGLSRTGHLFGGLKNDLKRKIPWYKSDFTDAMNMQCVASWIFLYFACLSPIITFGGLLGVATGNNMAAMESLVSGFICGIGYGLFSGQPLTILGSTGPVLVFETIVYKFCLMVSLDYMSFRFWIGTWICIILIVLVALDASAFVCYITRFTEENFATLIAFIFIFKAIENVLSIETKYPVNPRPNYIYDCSCSPPAYHADTPINWGKVNKEMCLAMNGTLYGPDCDQIEYQPNIFLMSIILFIGTFSISITLKDFKNSLFFPSKVRQLISDFSVIIAIFSMSLMDYYCGIATPKLDVPRDLKPTLADRGWIISPFKNAMWSWLLAFLPAVLGVILIFMDQQITAVIVNRKENKLKKGCGYHLDLFVLAILIQICTVLGLPWFVAATVLSITHVNSLKLESECAAPGEKPQFLGVREQRVTHICIFLMIGFSVFLTPILLNIPMPVLYGVFLYMGAASLKGLQLFDRILIIFMPVKYQPDYMFLRQVPIKRVHLFTLLQFACLVVLWMIKSYFYTSILFPLMLVVMIGIRKSLDCIFTTRELKILDDIMPEMSRRAAAVEDLEQLSQLNDGREPPPYQPEMGVPITSGNLMIIPIKPINITEEVNKTLIWKQVNENTNKNGLSAVKRTNKKSKERSAMKKDSAVKATHGTSTTNVVDTEHAQTSSMSQV